MLQNASSKFKSRCASFSENKKMVDIFPDELRILYLYLASVSLYFLCVFLKRTVELPISFDDSAHLFDTKFHVINFVGYASGNALRLQLIFPRARCDLIIGGLPCGVRLGLARPVSQVTSDQRKNPANHSAQISHEVVQKDPHSSLSFSSLENADLWARRLSHGLRSMLAWLRRLRRRVVPMR